MQYEVLYKNDNGTVRVRMTVGNHVLDQDFAADDLDANVKQGMAVFKAEIERNTVSTVDVQREVVTVDEAELPSLSVDHDTTE